MPEQPVDRLTRIMMLFAKIYILYLVLQRLELRHLNYFINFIHSYKITFRQYFVCFRLNSTFYINDYKLCEVDRTVQLVSNN